MAEPVLLGARGAGSSTTTQAAARVARSLEADGPGGSALARAPRRPSHRGSTPAPPPEKGWGQGVGRIRTGPLQPLGRGRTGVRAPDQVGAPVPVVADGRGRSHSSPAGGRERPCGGSGRAPQTLPSGQAWMEPAGVSREERQRGRSGRRERRGRPGRGWGGAWGVGRPGQGRRSLEAASVGRGREPTRLAGAQGRSWAQWHGSEP